MTRKHFEKAAEIVRSIRSASERKAVMNAMSELFASENPRFNRARFEAACEPRKAA